MTIHHYESLFADKPLPAGSVPMLQLIIKRILISHLSARLNARPPQALTAQRQAFVHELASGEVHRCRTHICGVSCPLFRTSSTICILVNARFGILDRYSRLPINFVHSLNKQEPNRAQPPTGYGTREESHPDRSKGMPVSQLKLLQCT